MVHVARFATAHSARRPSYVICGARRACVLSLTCAHTRARRLQRMRTQTHMAQHVPRAPRLRVIRNCLRRCSVFVRSQISWHLGLWRAQPTRPPRCCMAARTCTGVLVDEMRAPLVRLQQSLSPPRRRSAPQTKCARPAQCQRPLHRALLSPAPGEPFRHRDSNPGRSGEGRVS